MELGEADRLLTLLTKERGKVKAKNYGGRKLHSKLAGHLEPLTLANCQLEEGRTFYIISAAETIEPYSAIRNDLWRTSKAYTFLESVDVLTADEEAQPAVFDLLVEALNLLAKDRVSPILMTGFTLKLLTELGYRPQLHRCAHCQETLLPQGNVFSCALGGILDKACHREDDAAFPVSPSIIKVLRLLVTQPLGFIERLSADIFMVQQLSLIGERYLQYQMGKTLRSADFLKQVTPD